MVKGIWNGVGLKGRWFGLLWGMGCEPSFGKRPYVLDFWLRRRWSRFVQVSCGTFLGSGPFNTFRQWTWTAWSHWVRGWWRRRAWAIACRAWEWTLLLLLLLLLEEAFFEARTRRWSGFHIIIKWICERTEKRGVLSQKLLTNVESIYLNHPLTCLPANSIYGKLSYQTLIMYVWERCNKSKTYVSDIFTISLHSADRHF